MRILKNWNANWKHFRSELRHGSETYPIDGLDQDTKRSIESHATPYNTEFLPLIGSIEYRIRINRFRRKLASREEVEYFESITVEMERLLDALSIVYSIRLLSHFI